MNPAARLWLPYHPDFVGRCAEIAGADSEHYTVSRSAGGTSLVARGYRLLWEIQREVNARAAAGEAF